MSLKLPETALAPRKNHHYLLIDADIVAFRAAVVIEEEDSHYLGLSYALETINNIIDIYDSDDLVLCFSGANNFRKEVYPLYKYGRAPRPKHLQAIKKALMSRFESIIEDDQEADDVIAHLTYTHDLEEKRTVCVTIDKDLDQLHGLHYNFVKGLKYEVTEDEADYNLYIQLITGDRTDNIPGLRGYGPKKAAKVLGAVGEHTFEVMLYLAYQEYVKVYGNTKDAFEVFFMTYKLIVMNSKYTGEFYIQHLLNVGEKLLLRKS